MRRAFRQFKTRLGNTALGRHVRREWADPDVRQATKDAGVLYGTYKVTQKLPQWQSRAQARYAHWRNPHAADPMHILRQAYEGGRKLRPRRGLSMLTHGKGLFRRYAGAAVTKRGKSVLRLLKVVR